MRHEEACGQTVPRCPLDVSIDTVGFPSAFAEPSYRRHVSLVSLNPHATKTCLQAGADVYERLAAIARPPKVRPTPERSSTRARREARTPPVATHRPRHRLRLLSGVQNSSDGRARRSQALNIRKRVEQRDTSIQSRATMVPASSMASIPDTQDRRRMPLMPRSRSRALSSRLSPRVWGSRRRS